MRFDIVTIFPGFFAGPLDFGIVRRAREAGLLDVGTHDLREFTHDKHRSVDDRPFGGGEGMVLKPEPLFEAVESIAGGAKSALPGGEPQGAALPAGPPPGREPPDAALKGGATQTGATAIVLLSASGKVFRQADARRFASLGRIVLICGRYEGVDERVAQHLATEELSVGDFVLSGGEIAAALMVDAVTRLLPGALGNEDSAIYESFSAMREGEVIAGRDITAPPPAADASSRFVQPPLLLDYPHYTRPAEFRGWPVPEILIGGNHEEIRRWRRQMALEKTRRNRPDILGTL